MAGAISGATIASLIAMAAGAAMNYKASADATKRQNAAIRASLERQQALQEAAEKKAMDTAEEFRGDDRAANQAELEEQLTGEFIKPVEGAQEINSKATATQGAVSSDYDAAKTQSEVNLAKGAQVLARLLGKTTAAGRLRQNEALRLTDAASEIGTLASFARGRESADKIAIAQAGIPSAGLTVAGGLMSQAGAAGLSGAFNGTSTPLSSADSTIADWAGKSNSKIGVSAIPNTVGGASAPLGTARGGLGVKIPKNLVW